MAKERVINVREIWDLQTTPNEDGSFVVTFSTGVLKVNLHCYRSSLRYLAQDLWKVIENEDRQIADMRAAMSGN